MVLGSTLNSLNNTIHSDFIYPTAIITGSPDIKNQYTQNTEVNITITLNENILNFSESDIEVDNCTIQNFTEQTQYRVYTCKITSDGDHRKGDVLNSIIIRGNRFSDKANNPNIESDRWGWYSDTLAPVISNENIKNSGGSIISGSTTNDTSVDAGNEVFFHFTIIELTAVNILSKAVNDVFNYSNCTLGSLIDEGSGNYKIKLTPNSSSTTLSIFIKGSSFQDNANNQNSVSVTKSWTYDGVRPYPTNFTCSQGSSGRASNLSGTIDFSERVNNVTNSLVQISGLTVTVSPNGSGTNFTWSTSNTPDSDINYSIVMSLTGISDDYGNIAINAMGPLSYNLRKQPPTQQSFNITSNTGNNNDSTITAVLTFNEAVSVGSISSSASGSLSNNNGTNSATSHTLSLIRPSNSLAQNITFSYDNTTDSDGNTSVISKSSSNTVSKNIIQSFTPSISSGLGSGTSFSTSYSINVNTNIGGGVGVGNNGLDDSDIHWYTNNSDTGKRGRNVSGLTSGTTYVKIPANSYNDECNNFNSEFNSSSWTVQASIPWQFTSLEVKGGNPVENGRGQNYIQFNHNSPDIMDLSTFNDSFIANIGGSSNLASYHHNPRIQNNNPGYFQIMFNLTNNDSTSSSMTHTVAIASAGSLASTNGGTNTNTLSTSFNQDAGTPPPPPPPSFTIYVASIESEPSSYSFNIGGTTVSHIPGGVWPIIAVTQVPGITLDDIVNNTLQYNCPGGAGDYLEPHMLTVRAGYDTIRSNWVAIGGTMFANPGPSPPYTWSPGTTGTGTYNFNSSRKSEIESHVASNPSHTNIFFVANSADHD